MKKMFGLFVSLHSEWQDIFTGISFSLCKSACNLDSTFKISCLISKSEL